MPVDLVDHQFSIGGVIFGIDAALSVTNGTWEVGSFSHRTQDTDDAQTDTRNFGRDLLTPGSWSWELHTTADHEAGALQQLDALAGVWLDEAVREDPGAVVGLRYRIGDRTRIVYGRPRRWAPQINNRLLGGYIPINCDFSLADGVFYSDAEQSAQIDLIASVVGGLVTPLITPLTTLSTSAPRAGIVTVEGTAPTWAVLEFHGPVVNPWIAREGWRFDLNLTLAADEVVTVDPRPWAKSVTRAVGSSVASAVTGARLYDLRIPPGTSEIQYGGRDTTNSSYCVVKWRPAWRSI